MKVFIAGATGVLGRRVVRLLVAKGHTVAGLSRSRQNTAWLSQNGAEPRPGDLFNAGQMVELAAGCEAVLHLATAIPKKTPARPGDWALNDRIRREGTQALVEAALRNHCRLYVQQSVTFVYGDRQGAWTDEDTPIAADPGSVIQSAVDMEALVARNVRDNQLPAINLRFGAFYSHGSALTQSIFAAARRGQFPVLDGGGAYWSQINVDDAALAVLAAVERYPAGLGQTFNVCDDEPVTYRALADYIAQELGAPRPMALPAWLGRLLIGSGTVGALLASMRCRNQRLKDVLGWRPQYPTFREGYRAEIAAWLAAGAA